ncbi:hypothetical protein KFU94_21865 [Chloroflexi bacterium TSY]|nr:hypothetical protein [Chloroflexi bacterium TSY]
MFGFRYFRMSDAVRPLTDGESKLWPSWVRLLIFGIIIGFIILYYTLLSGKGLSDKGQTERGGKKNPP